MPPRSAAKITGHCNCQKHSITIDLPVIVSGQCHCTDCRRFSGATLSRNLMVEVKKAKVKSKGAKKWVNKGLNDQEINRWFCGDCGSSLWCTVQSMPEYIMPYAGLFEPGEVPAPTLVQWADRLEPWEKLPDGATVYKRDVDD